MSHPRQICRGISIDASAQATIEPELGKILFDLAIALEESTDLAVDVQHVVAAVLLASSAGDISSDQQLDASDEALRETLVPHVRRVFTDFGGRVGQDD